MSIEKGMLTSCTPAECYVWNRWQLALIIVKSENMFALHTVVGAGFPSPYAYECAGNYDIYYRMITYLEKVSRKNVGLTQFSVYCLRLGGLSL